MSESISVLLNRLPAVRLEVVVMSGRYRAVAIVRTTKEHIGTGAGSSPAEASEAALTDLVRKSKV